MSMINRESLLRLFDSIPTINGICTEPVVTVRDVKEIIKAVPEVDAVPLDKLCEWLSENSINIPCESCPNFLNEYCTAIGDASKPCPKTADGWRKAITKWMEAQNEG